VKAFAARFPFLFALTATLIGLLCQIWPLWISGLSLSAQILIGRFEICIFAIAILTYLGWWREAGFAKPKSWRILLPYLPLLLLVILAKITEIATSGIRVTDLQLIFLGFIVYLTGGFMEEAIFRGLVLRTLLPGGLIRAAILSALIFAVSHLFNLMAGADLNDMILQVIVAFPMGLAFTAPLAVTRNIWPAVFIHTLSNFGAYLTVGSFLNTAATSQSVTLGAAVVEILMVLPVAIYSCWLLLRVQKISQKTLLARTVVSLLKEELHSNQ
jgi:membrane protease YdiL (CAAX protease family)